VGRVRRKRTKGEKETEKIIYYITSLDFEVEQFGKAVREHWGVQNGLYHSKKIKS
jgi:predicted transposase YbfD/YdcC